MTDNGHSDLEEERNGDSGGGGVKLMELLNSQLQNAVKTEERYNHMKKQYDALVKAKAELDERHSSLKKENEELNQKFVEVLNEKKEGEDLAAERLKRTEEEKIYLEQRGKSLADKVEEVRAATTQLQLRLKETETNLQQSERKVLKGKEARKEQRESNRISSEENVKLREEVRWGKENNNRTLRELGELQSTLQSTKEAHLRLRADLADSNRAQDALRQQNEDMKAKLESEASENKRLWTLLEDIKNIKTAMHSETEASLFSGKLEEQTKKIKALKKENKELKEKIASILTNVTDHLSKPTTENDLKLMQLNSRSYISSTPPPPDTSARIFSSMNQYFQLTPTKKPTSLPTTPIKPSTPRPLRPYDDTLLLDYLEKKDTPVQSPASKRSGLSSSAPRRIELTPAKQKEISTSDEKEEKTSLKESKGKEKVDQTETPKKKGLLLDDYIDKISTSKSK